MATTLLDEIDAALVREIHLDWSEHGEGFITGHQAEQAAAQVRSDINESLGDFLLARAREMDRPVSLTDIMASVNQFGGERHGVSPCPNP